MRIKTVHLQWFRGAGSAVELATNGKSIVVYGANGAGKSSFVDAIEYMLSEGKIGHLSHEYSGKKQEKGVINTHKPALDPTTVSIGFTDGKIAKADIQTNGSFSLSGEGIAHLGRLDYRRIVLRQDEVAAFIRSQKGEKYSALLPLLGLEQLEAAAEGVRQLTRRVERDGKLDANKVTVQELEAKIGNRFKDKKALEDAVARLHARYRPKADREVSILSDCKELQVSIRSRLEAFTPDVQRYEALKRIADCHLDGALAAVANQKSRLAGASIKLLRERLEILGSLDQWLAKGAKDVGKCPACGQKVSKETLLDHIAKEKKALEGERAIFEDYKTSIETLKRGVAVVSGGIAAAALDAWLKAATEDWVTVRKEAGVLSLLGGEAISDDMNIAKIKTILVPLSARAEGDSKEPPPETRELLEDFQEAVAGQAHIEIGPVLQHTRSVNRALSHLNEVERAIRQKIREQADAAIAEISVDVQRMWRVLHPGKEIEDIRLKHPDETDKAIDIELKFFGVELKSPRLTLSEGNRNSLGLCVFLSMALRAEGDEPVVLDDVVVSLDREHRGMIVELLEKEFASRQVILFTHDRDWSAELRQFLDKGWQHLVLRPYGGPQYGIGWSDKVAAFDDARAQIASSPDGAGNTARKIMDTELALITDKLKVPMDYRQGIKNEHRMAHEFLDALSKAAGKAFQRKDANGDHKADDQLAVLLKEADKLVVAWGNKGSHSFDLEIAEATKLIDKCEEALKAFACVECGKFIGKLDDASAETKQCVCGAVRWRYGKLK